MLNGETLYTAYFEFFSFTAEIFPTAFLVVLKSESDACVVCNWLALLLFNRLAVEFNYFYF